ncbi:hypothetical protein [Caminibacter sp.]
MKEREVLLGEVEKVIERDRISISIIKNVIFIMIFSLVLYIPKIYVSNQIYIYSIKINKLINEYYSLKAENSILKSKIEKLKFKNRLNMFSF